MGQGSIPTEVTFVIGFLCFHAVKTKMPILASSSSLRKTRLMMPLKVDKTRTLFSNSIIKERITFYQRNTS